MCYNNCKKVSKTDFNNTLKEKKDMYLKHNNDPFYNWHLTDVKAVPLDPKALDRLVEDLLRGVPSLGTANPGSHRTHTRTVGEKDIVWRFPLAGAQLTDVSLEVLDGKLSLTYTKPEGGYTESFKETLAVPADFSAKHAEASLVNGLLTIVVPKAEKKPHKISIRG